MAKRKIPSAVAYKGNSKIHSKSLTVTELSQVSYDDKILKNLYCPTPGCNAKLVFVHGKHPYLRTLPSHNHNNDHISYCPYKVNVTNNGHVHHPVPAYISDKQVLRSDDYFLRKLGPKLKSYGGHNGTKTENNSNHVEMASNDSGTRNSTRVKKPSRTKGSKRNTKLRHITPDTLGPKSIDGMIFGGYLKRINVNAQSGYLVFTIEYNNVSKNVITTNNFFEHESTIVYEVKEIMSRVNYYLNNNTKVLFASYVTVHNDRNQTISLNDYYDMKFNIYGSHHKLTLGEFLRIVILVTNK